MLVTLSELKSFLGITDSSQDAKLQVFLDSVEASVINFCDVSFVPVPVTLEVHDGNESDTIIPDYIPLISVQAVKLGTEADGSGGDPLTAGRDFYFNENLIRLRNHVTPFFRGSLAVSYTHGYETVPADVKLAVMQSVKAEMKRDQENTEGVSSRSKGDESESLGSAWDAKSGLPKQIVSKLQCYKSYEFGGGSMAQRNY